MTTHYFDFLRTINPHFHTHEHPTQTSIVLQTTKRNPLRVVPEIQQRLQTTFGWKSLLFEETHDVHFPTPVVAIHGMGDPVLDVNYQWSTEYFHFLTEVLPNVLFLHTTYPNASIHCGVSPFTLPLFRWFGIQSEILSQIPTRCMRIEAPFVECGNPSPYKLNLLREKITEKVTFERTHGILIHRQKNRRLVNEMDVFHHVKQLYPHLTWVIFDSLSVEDTATLFSKAAVIVAPHGAGLTNMIFSPEGTEILEYMPIEQPNACYWHMAEMLKNPYRMIPCHIQNYQCDMIVDIKTI